jgi:hypothetical protein
VASDTPKKSLFAIEVSVCDAATNAVLLDSTHPDLQSIRISMPHTDVGTLSITLNNQRFGADGAPIYPPFKYNGMKVFQFGQRIRVDALVEPNAAPIPLFLARITDIAFSFPARSGGQMTLVGEDLLSLLKAQSEDELHFKDAPSEVSVVTALAKAAGFKPEAIVVQDPGLGVFPSEQRLEKNKSYLQLVQEYAEHIDFEVFAEFDRPTSASSQVSFHFEPARSGTYVESETPKLRWGENILQFTPRLQVWDQFTSFEARGSDPARRGTVAATATSDDILGELHAGTGGKPLSAADARDKVVAPGESLKKNPRKKVVTSKTQGRAQAAAVASLLKKAREFLTAEATLPGDAALRAGMHVDIGGLEAPFDGVYYVTKVEHSFDSDGFKTNLSLRRPGMLDPSSYVPGAN